MASRGGGAIFQPPRGRPSKVTKPSAAPRRRRPDTVPNQDPNLEQAFVGGSAGTADSSAENDGQSDLEPPQQQQPPPPPPPHEHEHEHEHDTSQQQQHHHHHHDDPHQPPPHHPHPDDESKYHDPSQLDPNHHHAAFDPEAAAAAAAAAAQAQQHQQQDAQMDPSTAASILSGGPGGLMGLNPHEHSDLAQHLGEGGEALGAAAAGGPGQATEEVARQSGYESVTIESALAKRLAREPGMRLAAQRRPEQVLNLQRRSNVEALFAHIAGEVAVVPCKNCHKGHGPWTSCVIVDGQMCGSCANCWFNASGARCSFHETRNPQTHAPVLGAPETGFQLHPVPQPIAAGSYNYASVTPTAVDPVVKYTVDRAMHDLRAADKRTRHMLMIEVAAKQLAYNILQYEEHQAQEEHQQHQHAHPQHAHPQQQPGTQPPQAVPEGSLMDEDPDAP